MFAVLTATIKIQTGCVVYMLMGFHTIKTGNKQNGNVFRSFNGKPLMYIFPWKVTLVPDSIQYVQFCPSVPRHLTMACLSIVAQMDGFQHATDAFFFKALALVDLRTGLYQLWRFNSTNLSSHSRDHVLMYQAQSEQHGWHLNSAGLPPASRKRSSMRSKWVSQFPHLLSFGQKDASVSFISPP